MVCLKCGHEINEGVDRFCTNCGALVPQSNQNSQNTIDNIQQAPVAAPFATPAQPAPANQFSGMPQAVGYGQPVKKNNSVKIAVIAIVSLVVLLCVGIFVGTAIRDAAYKKNLSQAVNSMYNGALKSEEVCGLIHDVWYNTIWEVSDPETDPYTKYTGYYYGSYFHDDFNDSLQALFDSSSYQADVSTIQMYDSSVSEAISKLHDPPDKYRNEYNQVMALYASYSDMYDCAVNPTGSLKSYTEKFNEADDDFVKQYKICQNY